MEDIHGNRQPHHGQLLDGHHSTSRPQWRQYVVGPLAVAVSVWVWVWVWVFCASMPPYTHPPPESSLSPKDSRVSLENKQIQK